MLCLDEHDYKVLRMGLRQNQSHAKRPLFIFPCGGSEDSHPSRKLLRDYIRKSKGLCNVVCLTAEDLANQNVLEGLSLVQQEAMLADICDWIIVFAESVGSFCELGAFTALPHIADITSVAVDRRYQGQHSYLLDGPVREVASRDSRLSHVFYLDLNNPMTCPELEASLSGLRDAVKFEYGFDPAKNRKPFNMPGGEVKVGSLVHEFLDLFQLLGPMTADEVIESYCGIMGFASEELDTVVSPTLEEDMKEPRPATARQVLAMMRAVGLIEVFGVPKGDGSLLTSRIRLEDYFRFRSSAPRGFYDARAKVALRRRSRGQEGYTDVYRRFDG